VAHNHHALEAAVAQVRQALATRDLRDLVVAIERTGRYHHVVQRAFTSAGFEVRIVHPFATRQFRQAQDPGNKTDDTDLVALQRAALNGFALLEARLDPAWQELQLLVRHRRDLVFKTSTLCCQIREHLDAAWPGYTACFGMLWDSAIPWCLVRQFESVAALHQAGLAGLRTCLHAHGIQFKQPTLTSVLEWAAQAAPGDTPTAMQRRLALALEGERQQKTKEIQALERELASRLARTPYVLLLSFPGVNVVSAAAFAGEMGPIGN
jgi:transposase